MHETNAGKWLCSGCLLRCGVICCRGLICCRGVKCRCFWFPWIVVMLRTSVNMIRATVLFSVKKFEKNRFLTVIIYTSVVAHAAIWMIIAWNPLCKKSWNATTKILTAVYAIILVSAALIHTIFGSKITSRFGIKHSFTAASSFLIPFCKNARSKKK